MKKIIFLVTAALAFGGLAFSDDAAAPAAPVVTIGDWGRQIFQFGNTDSGSYMGLGTSWGSSPRIVGLNIQAHNDTSGFSITPSADNGTFGLTDQNKAWITPLPGWTVESGINLETDTWRGTADYGTWDWVRFPGQHGDSFTFNRLGEPGAPTFESDINYNKDGIGFWLLAQNNAGVSEQNLGYGTQVGAAYAIPQIGTIKAQYLGYDLVNNYQSEMIAPTSTTNSVTSNSAIFDGTPYGVVQAAFNLSAVKGLYEEIGVNVPTSGTDAGYAVQVNDYTTVTVDKATFHLMFALADYNGNQAGTSSGLGVESGIGIDYDLGNMFTLSGDFRYINQLQLNGGASTSGTALDGFGAFLTKNFTNGDIGIGFEYSSIGWGGGTTGSLSNVTGSSSHWTVPIRTEEWF